MKKARVIAVCTVGLVLALLLGGLPNADPIHPAVNTGASVVYADQGDASESCPVNMVSEGFKCRVKCGPTPDGFGCWIECVF